MAISSDEIQFSIVREAAYGVTPPNPAFEVLPLTGEGIVAEVSSQQSGLMTEDRQVIDLITTSITAGGDISTELAITPAMKILLESVMAEDLVQLIFPIVGLPSIWETMIGKKQISFTVEKRFPDPAVPGGYLYHRIEGCVCNTANMAVTPEEPATISFGVIGKEMITDTAMIAGATYTTPSNPLVLRGPDTVKIDIKGHSVSTNCFGNFSWDINNNFRGILCLGHLGNKEMAIGRAEITAAMTLYFSSNELLDTLLTQAETSVEFEMKSGPTIDPGAYFATYFPRVKIAQDSIVAGGSGEDVVDDLSVQALFNSAGVEKTLGGNNADHTSMRVAVGSSVLMV